MNALSAQLSSSEIYQGCQTSSEHSICSPSSSEPFMSPSSHARELYEGLRTPDWLEQTDFEVVGGEEWKVSPSLNGKKGVFKDGSKPFVPRIFKLRELTAATNNFSVHRLLREEEFCKVYIGRLKKQNQVVAIKLFNNKKESEQAFGDEMRMLTYSPHRIVDFIGYCVKDKKKLVVSKYMSLDSPEDHLHGLPSERELLLEHKDEVSSCCCKGFGIFT